MHPQVHVAEAGDVHRIGSVTPLSRSASFERRFPQSFGCPHPADWGTAVSRDRPHVVEFRGSDARGNRARPGRLGAASAFGRGESIPRAEAHSTGPCPFRAAESGQLNLAGSVVADVTIPRASKQQITGLVEDSNTLSTLGALTLRLRSSRVERNWYDRDAAAAPGSTRPPTAPQRGPVSDARSCK